MIVPFIFGLIIGSFLNVVIHRLPEMARRKQFGQPGKYNLAWPASHCPNCLVPIRPWANIPLLSYLFLCGQCHHCASPISYRYPLVELASAILACLAVFAFGHTLTAAVGYAAAILALTAIILAKTAKAT